MKDKLVILSIPFQRLNRVLLGSHILDLLREEADVLIVSPFSDDPAFQHEFKGESIYFLESIVPQTFKEPYGKLYALSEVMRMQGYWMLNRNRGMAEFLANSDVQYSSTGKELRRPWPKRMVFTVLRAIGAWSRSWRILDRIAGPSVFKFSKLITITEKYKSVALIQSASWGFQDRMLAWLARQHQWKTVLIPYTTDQVHSNGFLLSDFDAVCVQGPAEADYAKRLHHIPENRIKKLGSPWLRHMEVLENEIPTVKKKESKTIMFAGLATLFFPLESQFDIVDRLLAEIKKGNLGKVGLSLRPVALSQEETETWTAKYGHLDNVIIQWPQAACLGIDFDPEAQNPTMKQELTEFVKQISGVDLLVISGFTTLMIEAAHFGIPSISVFADRTGILKNRNADLMIRTVVKSLGFNTLPIVHELDELALLVKEILYDPAKAKHIADGLLDGWDYPDADYKTLMKEALFG